MNFSSRRHGKHHQQPRGTVTLFALTSAHSDITAVYQYALPGTCMRAARQLATCLAAPDQDTLTPGAVLFCVVLRHAVPLACPAGSYKATGGISCDPCKVGSYAVEGADACTLCPEGMTTMETGSKTLEQCGRCMGMVDGGRLASARCALQLEQCSLAAGAGFCPSVFLAGFWQGFGDIFQRR